MDRQHVEQLFRQHYRRMYSVACSLLYDGQESEDVVSEVFAHLLESGTELLPASAEGYLMVAVRNRCLKRLGDKSNRERILRLYTDELHDGDDWLDDERRLKQLHDDWHDDERELDRLRQLAHALLSSQELHLFTQRFLDGKDYKAICAETGTSRIAVWKPGTSRIAVWKHLSHIVKVLKENIKTPEP